MKPTAIIADDHPLLLEGNKQFLEQKGFNVIATATNGNKAYNAIIRLQPDFAILDFNMPKLDGIEISKELKKNNCPSKIIIFTLHKEEAILQEVGKSIEGYLVKEDTLKELETCIQHVLEEKNYISSILKDRVHLKTSATDNIDLTATEIKILKYLASNLSSTQIAKELFISSRTVEKHRSNIIKKLNLGSEVNALILWIQQHPEFFTT